MVIMMKMMKPEGLKIFSLAWRKTIVDKSHNYEKYNFTKGEAVVYVSLFYITFYITFIYHFYIGKFFLFFSFFIKRRREIL